MADEAVATMEKVFESGSEDAIKQAAVKLSRALGALAKVVSDEDAEVFQSDPPKVPLPTRKLDSVRPSVEASDRLLSAVIPPDQDFEAAKKHLAEVRRGLANARKSLGL